MKTIKAIIIDDEEGARRLLKNALEEHNTNVEVLQTCANVPEGVLAINQLEPDVVFLDIEMPMYSGLELLGFFKEISFEIIFVTAYNQYAVQAFEVSAIDYILKPIRLDKLESAIEKLRARLAIPNMSKKLETLKSNMSSDRIEKIAVPVSDGLIFIKVSEICHIEADGSYSTLLLLHGNDILVSKKLKYFEAILEDNTDFYRVHRSNLVNIQNIQKYKRHESNVLMENGSIVKVARDNKAAFEKRLKALHT